MPAIFECSEFALVPQFAVRAIIEIKRKGTKSERECLTEQAKERQHLLPTASQMDFVLGIILNDAHDPHPLFDDDHRPAPNWLREHWQRSAGVPGLSREYSVITEPDTNGIMAFIYFLAQVAAFEPTISKGQ